MTKMGMCNFERFEDDEEVGVFCKTCGQFNSKHDVVSECIYFDRVVDENDPVFFIMMICIIILSMALAFALVF